MSQPAALAVGLSGIDACLTEAEQMRAGTRRGRPPVRSNAAILKLLAANGYLPVVACVAGDKQGNIYNVNADQMAVACASGYGADRLISSPMWTACKARTGEIVLHPDTCRLRKADYGRCRDRRNAGEAERGNGCSSERNRTGDHRAGRVGSVRPSDSLRRTNRYTTDSWFIAKELSMRNVLTLDYPTSTALDSGLIVRKASMPDIHALLQLINGYAAQGVMLPRTEFEMSENIRDFTLVFSAASCRAAARCTFIRPPAEKYDRSLLIRAPRVAASAEQ